MMRTLQIPGFVLLAMFALEICTWLNVASVIGAGTLLLWMVGSLFIGFRILRAAMLRDQTHRDSRLLIWIGVLLVCPGVLSDVIAAFLVAPWLYYWARRRISGSESDGEVLGSVSSGRRSRHRSVRASADFDLAHAEDIEWRESSKQSTH